MGFIVSVIVWVACGYVAKNIAIDRNHPDPEMWFWLGIFFGVLAVIAAVIFIKDESK